MQSVARGRAARIGALLVLALAAGPWLLPPARSEGARAGDRGASSWPAPETLPAKELGTDETPTPVALDPAGNAVAVWSETTSNGFSLVRAIRGAARPAGGSWQPARPLLGTGIDPALSLDGNGDATAVWQADISPYPAVATSHPARGAWLTPVPAATSPGETPLVASDARGESIVVWSQSGAGRSEARIEATLRPVGARFSPPVALSPADGAFYPRIAMDAQGDALVAWEAKTSGEGCAVRAAFRGANRRWEAQRTLSRHAGCPAEQRVAIGPGGQAIIVWEAQRGSKQFLEAAVRTAGGRWLAPRVLSEAQILNGPEVATDARGDALVVWTKVRPADASDVIQTRSYGVHGWGAQQNVPGASGSQTSLALDGRGDVLLAWQAHGSRVEASARAAGGRWQQPQTLSRRPPSGTPPGVALDARGDALVSWDDEAGIETVWRGSLFAP